MALAVAEAHRILRPGGWLLDLHPAGVAMRLEAWLRLRPGADAADAAPDPADYRRRPLGELAGEESLPDFAAASVALVAAVGQGFEPGQTLPFEYQYFFDSLDELTDYLEENEERALASDELLERALHAAAQATTSVKLVLIQPVMAASLRRPRAS